MFSPRRHSFRKSIRNFGGDKTEAKGTANDILRLNTGRTFRPSTAGCLTPFMPSLQHKKGASHAMTKMGHPSKVENLLWLVWGSFSVIMSVSSVEGSLLIHAVPGLFTTIGVLDGGSWLSVSGGSLTNNPLYPTSSSTEHKSGRIVC